MVNCYTGQHEVGAELCEPEQHCFACNKDEQGPAYIVCGECFHLFRSRWTLWRDRIDTYADIFGWRHPFLMLRIFFRRPKKIYSCPKCAHDF